MDTFEGCSDMSDYNTWDVNACVKLACEVARVQSEEYIRLYRMSKNTRLPEKILTAMERAFTGHKIEISYNFNAKIYCVFIDDNYVGNFEDRFCEKEEESDEKFR